MSKNLLNAFRPTTLTYSSPAVDTTSTVPNSFYNAFPDLNDMAPDESHSAFPRRAKYLLPLDSMFLPSAMFVDGNSIDQDRLASLDSKLRERIASIFDKVGHHNLSLRLPRKPELSGTFHLENLLEIPHKRLAATDYKWALRTYHLASFYTTLEIHLERGQRIDVPLIKDDSPRASRLQRHWKAVFDAFQPTVLLDEAAALLICVTLFPHEELAAHEQVWVENEEAEIRGISGTSFTDVYWKLRDQFNPESCTAEADRRELAERILQYAKGALSSSTAENLSLAEEVYLNLEEKKQRIYWPRILGDEVHGGLRQLRMQNDLVLGRVGARISIPEAMQWLMALFSVLDDKENSFNRKSCERYTKSGGNR